MNRSTRITGAHADWRRGLLLAVVAGATLATTTPADATPGPACGAVITTHITLHHDLTDCSGTGLVIGADGVTVDLNGHTITEDAQAAPCPEGDICSIGVDDSGSFDDVTITGGTIRGFTVGVLAEDAHRTAIRDSTFAGNGLTAVVLGGVKGADLERNTVTASGGYAMILAAVTGVQVRRNALDGDAHGIGVFGASTGTVIAGNTVSHSDGSSIDVGDGSTGTHVEGNVLTDDGDGIVLTNAQNTTVARNTVTGTGFSGSPDTGGFGLITDGSDATTIDRNTITGGRGPALYITQLEGTEVPSRTTASRNIISSAGADGILVDAAATDTHLERNNASGSALDGIHVLAASTTLGRNTANHNGAFGIEAVFGVTDDGGNHASGNGNPAQCVGVFCSA